MVSGCVLNIVLYATNLLPSDRIAWSPIDEQHSKLIFTYKRMSLPFKITFNDPGTKRFMDEKNLATWVIYATEYRNVNNVLIPSRFEALWRLGKGDSVMRNSKSRRSISELADLGHLHHLRL